MLIPLTGKSGSSIFNFFRYFLICHLLRKADVMATLYKIATSTSGPAWTCLQSTSFSSPYFICFITLILFMYLVVFLLIFYFSYYKAISPRGLFMACSWLYLFYLCNNYLTISFSFGINTLLPNATCPKPRQTQMLIP